jgi:hypothetical protein
MHLDRIFQPENVLNPGKLRDVLRRPYTPPPSEDAISSHAYVAKAKASKKSIEEELLPTLRFDHSSVCLELNAGFGAETKGAAIGDRPAAHEPVTYPKQVVPVKLG